MGLPISSCILQKKFHLRFKMSFPNPFFKDLNSGSMLFSFCFDLRKKKKKKKKNKKKQEKSIMSAHFVFDMIW